MDKINLYGNLKVNNNATISGASTLYGCNLGNCGNVINSQNSISNFYNVGALTLGNNRIMAYNSTSLKYWSTRLDALVQLTIQQFFQDVGVTSTSANASVFNAFYSNTTPNLFYHYGRTYIAVGGNTTLSLRKTDIDYKQELRLFGPNTLTPSMYLNGNYNNNIISGIAIPITQISTTLTGVNGGLITVQPIGAYGVKYLFKMSCLINATFTTGASITIDIHLNGVVIQSQTMSVSNQQIGHKFFMTKVIQLNDAITSATSFWVGFTYNYTGATGITPIASSANSNVNCCARLIRI